MHQETQYLDLLDKAIQRGNPRMDRTGTGTRSLFGERMVFNVSQSFPLLTTKKLHWNSIAYELLWFLRGDTNAKWLQERKVRIWDAWQRPYTKNRPLVWVDPKEAHPDAGYSGQFSYSENTLNLAHGSDDARLAAAWSNMMKRCYDKQHHRFSYYGGRGVTVHPAWHDVRSFIEGAKNLPHWSYKRSNWEAFELDKDYYGSGQYGPDTCVWLRSDENNEYTRSANPISVTFPGGKSELYLTQAEAAKEIGMSTSSLSRILTKGQPTVLKGANKAFLGFDFDLPKDKSKMLRRELIEDGELGPIYGKQWRSWAAPNGESIDQITRLIDGLRNNPYGRRHIVSAWNPADIDDMALPPCHCLFQFFVDEAPTGGMRLSCQLYQRSADIFLGVPFNIASYSLLLKMVAAVVGMKPGKFVHSFGDLHIYENHIDQAKEQLQRAALPFPTLDVAQRDSVFDYGIGDFTLRDYNSWPAIKAKVAV